MMGLRELFFFRWRKASKCKKMIKSLQIQLKLLKNKRSRMIRFMREDILLLLKLGYYRLAVSLAGKLIGDENAVELYDLLDHYCEFLLLNFTCIRKNKDCPNDIMEAMSSLVFASTRCEQLPELAMIGELFTERYSQLHSTNLVNSKVVENILLMKSVPDDLKHKLVDEISRSVMESSEPVHDQGSMDIDIRYSSDSSSTFSILLPEMESFVLPNPKTETIPEEKLMVPNYNTYGINSSSELAAMVYSPSSILLPEMERILNPESSLESPLSVETIYQEYSSDMQLIPHQEDNNKDDHMKEEEVAIIEPCKHVHPKLPYYDQLVETFAAMKRSNLLLDSPSQNL